MASKPSNRSVEILSRVKQVVETDMVDWANYLIESGDWILIDICRGKYAKRVYALGRIR